MKVAVRVRPFNDRERQMGCRLAVDMVDSTTIYASVERGEKELDRKKASFRLRFAFLQATFPKKSVPPFSKGPQKKQIERT